MDETNKSRLRIVWVTPELIEDVFTEGNPRAFRVVTGLPIDAKLVHSLYGHPNGYPMVGLVFHSETFEETTEAIESIPEFCPTFLKMKPVELPSITDETFEQYLRKTFDDGLVFHHLCASPTAEGKMKFYIHAADAASNTLDYVVEDNTLSPVTPTTEKQ